MSLIWICGCSRMDLQESLNTIILQNRQLMETEMKAGDQAEIIFGHGIDDSLGSNIKLEIIGSLDYPAIDSLYNLKNN
jgi:hypothetical protein